VKEKLAQSLFDHIPVGVGSQGIIPTSAAALESALSMGMDWCAARCVCDALLVEGADTIAAQVAARGLRLGGG